MCLQVRLCSVVRLCRVQPGSTGFSIVRGDVERGQQSEYLGIRRSGRTETNGFGVGNRIPCGQPTSIYIDNLCLLRVEASWFAPDGLHVIRALTRMQDNGSYLAFELKKRMLGVGYGRFLEASLMENLKITL